MISNKYLHNLRGSPFITELDWINEFKYTDLKNPTPSKDPNMDKFKNIKPVKKIDLKNPLNKQKLKLSPKDNGNKLKLNPNYSNKNKLKLGSDLGPTELDFIKIIDEVCKMIITKMKDAAGVENQSKPTTSISTVKNKEGDNSYSIEEIIKELEDDEEAGGGRLSNKPVAKTEEEAGGWLLWFRGHYKKFRTFGLDLNISKNIQMSDGHWKIIKLKWSNKVHRNRILVLWSEDPEKLKNLSHTSSELEEAEINKPVPKTQGEIVLFEFWDDQINKNSPSYVEPSVKFLLETANRNSNLIKRIVNSKEFTKIEKDYSIPLYDSFLAGVEQKWMEYKGFKIDPEKVKFKFDPVKNVIQFDDVDGDPQRFSLEVISSILAGKNPNDENLKATGKDFGQFVIALKNANFDASLLTDPDAIQNYGEAESGDGNVEPVEDDIFNIPAIKDAVLALTTLGYKEKDVKIWMRQVVNNNGTSLKSDEYVEKVLAPNKKPNPDPSTELSTNNISTPVKNEPVEPVKSPNPPQPSNIKYSKTQDIYIKKYPQLKPIIDKKLQSGYDSDKIDKFLINFRRQGKRRNIEKSTSKLDTLEEYNLLNLV